jgi:hypothetical protein
MTRKEYYQSADQKEKAKLYREKNKDKILAYFKEYRKQNKEILSEKAKERSKKYYLSNKEKVLAKQAKRRNDPEKKDSLNAYAKEYSKKRRDKDTVYKITVNLRARFTSILKAKKILKNNSVVNLTGCTIEFLKDYLESKFLPTMSWENYGKYWHIDHIKPCSLFDLSDIKEQNKCFHYTNLQPLFAVTTIIEGVEYIGNTNKRDKYDN